MTISHAVRVARWPRQTDLISWKQMEVVVNFVNGGERSSHHFLIRPFCVGDLRQQVLSYMGTQGLPDNSIESVFLVKFC